MHPDTAADEIDIAQLKRWPADTRDIPWDYKNIVKRKAGSAA